MSRNSRRPLSPHLTIWKWGPHMMVSILHRATGTAMAIGAASLLVWWLAAAASGPQAYETFLSWATWWPGYVVAIGFTWTFFQHMFSGIRHLVLDTGAGYELRVNKMGAIATMIGSITLTALVWALILARH
jgi:succinate dehydrogenase / fumarate reductase, cytochrome b subunit